MLTDEQLAEIRARYVAKRDTKCRMGVDADVGAQEYLDWLEEYGKWWLAHEAFGNSAVADMGVLLAEVERLRGDAELGRLVREVLPRIHNDDLPGEFPSTALFFDGHDWLVMHSEESLYDVGYETAAEAIGHAMEVLDAD